MIESDYEKIVWCLNKNDYYDFLKNIRSILLEQGFDIWLDRDIDFIVEGVLKLFEEAELRPCTVDHLCAKNYLILYWETKRDWFWCHDDDEVAALHRYITDVYEGNCDYIVVSSNGEVSYYREDLGFIHPYVGFKGMGEKEEEEK